MSYLSSFLIGALAGAFDAANRLSIRDSILSRATHRGGSMDGFDLVSDAHLALRRA